VMNSNKKITACPVLAVKFGTKFEYSLWWIFSPKYPCTCFIISFCISLLLWPLWLILLTFQIIKRPFNFLLFTRFKFCLRSYQSLLFTNWCTRELLQRNSKICIKTPATCFGSITIIRERIIWAC
jgi:hypothetical protein